MPAEPDLVTADRLRRWTLPEPESDKESRGRVLVVGGSLQTPGAVLLAGEAALRAGGGKLQMATVAGVVAALAVAVPEGRVLPLPATSEGMLAAPAAAPVLEAAERAAVVLLGPGLVDLDASTTLMERVVPRLDTLVVVDGLASGFVTAHPEGLRHLAGRCVLTLNPTELSRVLGRDDAEVAADQTRATLDAAASSGAVVLCGGTVKTVATPEGDAWLVREGGPGLGVSGSGDVQSGIVAGLLARGAGPAQAAVWGAALHGRAGERLAVETGPVGFLARQLPGELPGLLAELTR